MSSPTLRSCRENPVFAMISTSCVSVAVLLLLGACALSSAQSYGPRNAALNRGQNIQFPVQRTCVGSRLDKVSLVQDMYVQYAEFVAEIPALYAFHTCLWLKLDTVEDRLAVTTLNYGLDELVNTDNLTVQYHPSKQIWSLNINGYRVFNARADKVVAERWNHFCQSWDGRTGEWNVWQNGALLDKGVNHESVGLVVPGGGTMIAGQHQNTFFDGTERVGMDDGEGVIGSFTLVYVSREPIPITQSRGTTQQYMRLLANDCTANDRGDLVSWLSTPRMGYGGMRMELARESCGHF